MGQITNDIIRILAKNEKTMRLAEALLKISNQILRAQIVSEMVNVSKKGDVKVASFTMESHKDIAKLVAKTPTNIKVKTPEMSEEVLEAYEEWAKIAKCEKGTELGVSPILNSNEVIKIKKIEYVKECIEAWTKQKN